MASTQKYEYKSINDWLEDIVFRTAICFEATELIQLKRDYPPQLKGQPTVIITADKANSWEPMTDIAKIGGVAQGKYTGIKLKAGAQPVDGLKELFSKEAVVNFDCNTSIRLIMLKALSDVTAAADFNAKFKGLQLGSEFVDKKFYPPYQVLKNNPGFTLIPGDWIEFVDLTVPAASGWQHENSLYVGNGFFYAHLTTGKSGLYTEDQLNKLLNEESKTNGNNRARIDKLKDPGTGLAIKDPVTMEDWISTRISPTLFLK